MSFAVIQFATRVPSHRDGRHGRGRGKCSWGRRVVGRYLGTLIRDVFLNASWAINVRHELELVSRVKELRNVLRP